MANIILFKYKVFVLYIKFINILILNSGVTNFLKVFKNKNILKIDINILKYLFL